MPIYDYRCTRCGRAFSVEQSIRDKPLKRCKECGGKLEKMLPKTVNLIFKGPGFYVTDYRKTRPKSRKAGGKAGKEPAEQASEG